MLDFNELLSGMGKRIYERRKQLGLSQEALAEKAEISVQMLSTAERGAKAIRPINLLKLSVALGVSADYLLTGIKTDRDDMLLSDRIATLSHYERKALEDIIDSFLSVCKKSDD